MPGDDLRRHCGDGRRPRAGAVSDTDIELRESPRGGLVATVCHDNAAKLNVMDGDGTEALAAAIRRACEGRDVRVVVLRGAVERSGASTVSPRGSRAESRASACGPFSTASADAASAARRLGCTPWRCGRGCGCSGGKQRDAPGGGAGTVPSRLAPTRQSQLTKAVRQMSARLRSHQLPGGRFELDLDAELGELLGQHLGDVVRGGVLSETPRMVAPL